MATLRTTIRGGPQAGPYAGFEARAGLHTLQGDAGARVRVCRKAHERCNMIPPLRGRPTALHAGQA